MAAIREQLKLLADYLYPQELKDRAAALEAQMGAPGFWDDAEAAGQVGVEHSKAKKRLEESMSLQSDVEDLDGLIEMAAEDSTLQGEIDEQFASVEERLAGLRSNGCSPGATTRATRSSA